MNKGLLWVRISIEIEIEGFFYLIVYCTFSHLMESNI